MQIRRKTVFRLGELDELIRHLRSDPVPLEVLDRRHKLAKESRRILKEQEPLSIDVEELVRAEQGDEGG